MSLSIFLLFSICLTVLLYLIIFELPEQKRRARIERKRTHWKRRQRLLQEYEEFKEIADYAEYIQWFNRRWKRYAQYGINIDTNKKGGKW